MFLKSGKLLPIFSAGVVLFLFTVATAAQAADNGKLSAALEAEQLAFEDAKALNDHAVAFLLSQKVYKLAKQLYSDEPKQLGPLVYQYATAAARINEPNALALFDEAAGLYTEALGQDAQELTPVLAASADEAIKRNRSVEAYERLKVLEKNIDGSHFKAGFFDAKRVAGLAMLYLGSGERDRALFYLNEAKSLLATEPNGIDAFDYGQVLFHVAELEENLGSLAAAAQFYEKSLKQYVSADPKERNILTIHRRLMRINHQLGDYKATCNNIIDAYKFRSWALDIPAFDPNSKYSLSQVGSAVGRISFRLRINSDCKAEEVEILKSEGLTPEEVKAWLESVYLFVPTLVVNRESGESQTVEDTWILFHAEAGDN